MQQAVEKMAEVGVISTEANDALSGFELVGTFNLIHRGDEGELTLTVYVREAGRGGGMEGGR